MANNSGVIAMLLPGGRTPELGALTGSDWCKELCAALRTGASASVTMAGFSNAFLIRVDLGVSERLTLSISMNYDLLLKF